MNLQSLIGDDYLFWEALVLSLAIHLFVSFKAGEFSLNFQQKHTVEIDITNMGHVGMTAAPKQTAPPPRPVVKPKEWIQPKPSQKVAPAATPTQPVSPPPEEPPPQEYNVGTGETTTTLSRIPQLLNLSDLRTILQRFYPEQARADGRQATVVLDLHIDTDGHVQNVEVVRSGGADFDAAAVRAVKLLRFTPAFLGSQRVGVKMRQAIQFKLEE